MLKLAKKICDLQGIKMHIQVPVLCPSCNRRTLILDHVKQKGVCIRCKKEIGIMELYKLEETDWVEKHKGTDIQMRENRGDCG